MFWALGCNSNPLLASLQLENRSLAVRKDILLGAWLTSRQAAHFLAASTLNNISPQQRASSQLHAAQELEDHLLTSLGSEPALLSDPVKPWVPWKATPGISRQLLTSFIDLNLVHGKAQASLLGSTVPSSVIICPLLCLCYDPAASPGIGKGAGRAAYVKAHQQLEALLSQAASAQDGSPMKAHLMREIAVIVLLASQTEILGDLVLGVDHHVHEHVFLPGGEQYLPPDALLDQLADKVHISQEQVRDFLSVVEVYKHLLNPLAKEKTAIVSRLNQLLQMRECPAPSSSAQEPASPAEPSCTAATAQAARAPAAAEEAPASMASTPEGAVAAGTASAPAVAAAGTAPAADSQAAQPTAAAASTSAISLGSSSVGSDVGAVMRVSSSAAVGGCSHAASPSAANCDGSTTSHGSFLSCNGSSTSSRSLSTSSSSSFPLDGTNHYEVLALLKRLDATMTKTRWLDKCCFFTCLGSLTWWQIATLWTGFHPFPPLCGLWVRRIVARASFPLLIPVQVQPLPRDLLSPLERWRLQIQQQELEECQQQHKQRMTGQFPNAAATTPTAAAGLEPVVTGAVAAAAAGGDDGSGGAWSRGDLAGISDSVLRSWGTLPAAAS